MFPIKFKLKEIINFFKGSNVLQFVACGFNLRRTWKHMMILQSQDKKVTNVTNSNMSKVFINYLIHEHLCLNHSREFGDR